MNNFILKLIQNLPPETSHSLTIKLLKLKPIRKLASDDPSLHQHIFGLDFNNPIRLAAGFDKNAEVINALLNLGFGFIEAGTVTPKSQLGNNRPRIFRLKEDQAIINNLGFNNFGHNFKASLLNYPCPNTSS